MPSASKAKIKSALKAFAVTLVIIVPAVILIAGQNTGPRVSFANSSLDVEVADTQTERRIGLGGRDSLPEGTGMLFVFNISSIYGFWMEKMQFPIDILWLDEDKRIIHVETHISPDTYPQIFYPNLPARYVLEANAGWAESHGVRVGDIAHFDL